jgi:hypothetical protein
VAEAVDPADRPRSAIARDKGIVDLKPDKGV